MNESLRLLFMDKNHERYLAVPRKTHVIQLTMILRVISNEDRHILKPRSLTR